MYSTANCNRMVGLAVTTAMAGALLTGCASNTGAVRADLSAAKAQDALARGKTDKALTLAEAAVSGDPRNAEYRFTLGQAYLDAGRFASAATAFDDAMRLGDSSPRTALSLALALTGEGKHGEALALLKDWESALAPSDAGLAYTLAGQPERGIHIMGNAIRAGDNTAKMRQNLAYSFAMAGRWREARLMAAQDVPADKLGARLEEWAQMARPQAWQQRVAALLEVPAGISDPGEPVALALNDAPSDIELATAAAPEAAAGELPPLEPTVATAQPAAIASVDPDPAPAPVHQAGDFHSTFASARSAAPTVSQDAARFTQAAVVQPAPAKPRPAAAAAHAPRAASTHLVQLGSFTSEQAARRAWGVYTKRYPALSEHRMVISEATVKGKRYWRVAAGGFDRTQSQAMCGTVKASGQGCIAYAESNPLPGAIDSGLRMASR